MFKAVILRSRGQDSGRLSRQGFQRLAMGDPERLSLPPWENEKMRVRQESVWPVGCHLPSIVPVLRLSNHKPSSQASSGLYGSRFDCFLETQSAECLPPAEVRAPDIHLGLEADPEYLFFYK